MNVIVGLGNPGNKYQHTRHNAGFDTISILSTMFELPVKKIMCKSLVGEGNIGGNKIVLAMPQTFMNDSGIAVLELMKRFNAELHQLIVIYDDVDLPLGSLRLRGGGSAGSHNGMRSIIYHLGDQMFSRVRIGIGKPPENMDLAKYVLSHYNTAEEREAMFSAFNLAAQGVLDIINNGIDFAMQKHNTNNNQPQQLSGGDT